MRISLSEHCEIKIFNEEENPEEASLSLDKFISRRLKKQKEGPFSQMYFHIIYIIIV